MSDLKELEPVADGRFVASAQERYLLSIAVSLKRIADSMEKTAMLREQANRIPDGWERAPDISPGALRKIEPETPARS